MKMNRKRTLSSAVGLPRLQSFPEFCASVPPLESQGDIASVLDLYCVKSQLHNKGVMASLQAGRTFHYFVTSRCLSRENEVGAWLPVCVVVCGVVKEKGGEEEEGNTKQGLGCCAGEEVVCL